MAELRPDHGLFARICRCDNYDGDLAVGVEQEWPGEQHTWFGYRVVYVAVEKHHPDHHLGDYQRMGWIVAVLFGRAVIGIERSDRGGEDRRSVVEAYPEEDTDAGTEADDRVDIDTRDGLVDAGIFLGATDGAVSLRRDADVGNVYHGVQVQQVRQGECVQRGADVYYSDDSDHSKTTNDKERAVKYVLIILITLLAIWPVYWLVLGSFQSHAGTFTFSSLLIPKNMHLQNYRDLFSHGYTFRWILNTLFVLVCQCTFTLIIVATAGMGFGLYRFPGKNVIFWGMMAMMMVPGSMFLIGKILVAREVGLTGNLWGAFVPILFFPMGIYLFRTFVEGISTDMLDAARIDGAGELRILKNIVLPACIPAVGLILLFTSLTALNNYLWQSIILQKMELKTLLVGLVVHMQSLALINNQEADVIGVRLAAGVILMIPSVIIFAAFNKHFIKNIKLGALKK